MLVKQCHRGVFIEVVRAWVLASLIRSICNLQPAPVWSFEFGIYTSDDSAYGPGLANEYKDEGTKNLLTGKLYSRHGPSETCLMKLEKTNRNLNPKILALSLKKKQPHSWRNSPKALKIQSARPESVSEGLPAGANGLKSLRVPGWAAPSAFL